jgi:cobalt-zinc-cadmium efflux system protein
MISLVKGVIMGAGHGHGHGHSGADARAAATSGRIKKMVVALGILIGFLVLEVVVGLLINSLALLADAGHMLTDVLGLVMGLTALLLARRGSAAAARTFGWHRAEVLTAVANAVLLLVVAAWVFYEAIKRIGDAPEVPGWPLILTAAAGLLANVVVLLLLRGDSKESIAVKGAYMEVLADAVGSVGVLFAGACTLLFGWVYADIVVGVAISLWIVPRAIALAASALRILTQASPAGLDVEEVRGQLAGISGVVGVHDLHVWTLTTGMDVVTVHLTSDGVHEEVLQTARELLSARGLDHATVQIETRDQEKRCEKTVTW